MVASASKTEVNLYRAGEGAPVSTFGSHQADVSAICFHPDGNRLFTGDVLGNIYLWDIEGNDGLIELVGHDAAITSLAITPSDSSLLSGDAEGHVYAWRSAPQLARYERWRSGTRTALREKRIMRYFDGDKALAYQRLSEGVPGLDSEDPVVVRMLGLLAPAGEGSAKPDGE